MKTRIERAYLEASVIGDSHAMSVWKHLAPAIVFRHSMTAPAKHFDGQFYTAEKGGLHITSAMIREAFPRADADVIQVMVKARERLDAQLQTILAAGLPVVSSLGAASYRFARRVQSADPDNGALFSRKILRAAAGDYVETFVGFHEELLRHVPAVSFLLGACRYPDNQKDAWLAYDQVMIDRLSAIGVRIIDVRAQTGDDQLRLLPEYQAQDVLHGNDQWCQIVAERIIDQVGPPTGQPQKAAQLQSK
ncbi:hypothetical protein [Paracoccus indicus]|uniref:hypothetical protein n=1 Tax=Paracoccus indicus TaxID=2079229 RepID=UPI000D3619F6|nr:hypothetical protein [Paracoccus indicus]